jgi:cytochrome P450
MMSRTDTAAPTVDLDDSDLFVHGDPHAAWRWLRENEPVRWNATAAGGFWALTTYEDVRAAYLDPTTFSSAGGTVMGGSYRSDRDTATGRMLICSDSPEHRLLRQQVHKAFGPDTLARASRQVRRYLTAALDRVVADGGGDLATDVARELPAGFLAAMFGLGREDAGTLLGLTEKMIGHRDDRHSGRSAELTLVGAQVEIFDMMAELLALRRARPGDDIVSVLLDSEINGRPMSDDEILYNCLNVAVGGNETTPYTASATVVALVEHPGEADRLLADPALVPTAVDELFRWTSTNAYVQRTATRDTTIRDVPIAAGDSVTLWNASANRDPLRFPDPDRFDVERRPNPHIAFGLGAHRCIGVAAAQLEITLFVEEIVARGLRFELTAPPARLRSNFMLGITSLPFAVTAG